MPTWSTETLLAAALIALFSIFNLIVRKLRERAQAARAEPVVGAPAGTVPDVLNDYEWGGAAPAMPGERPIAALPVVAPVTVPVQVTANVRQSRSPSPISRVRADLRSPRSVQEAIVLMAVLGPCRADDPGAGMPGAGRGPGERPSP